MGRLLFLGVLVVLLAATSGHAQPPEGAFGAALGNPAIERLPSPDPLPWLVDPPSLLPAVAPRLPVDAPPEPPYWLVIPLPDLRTTENIVPLPPVAAPVRLWEGSFELGLNGSEGNAPALDFRFGFDAKRKTPQNVFWINLNYNKKTTNNAETQNRAFLESRDEQLYPNSPWKSFVHGTFEYDEFKPYDVRIAGDLGLGRQLYKDDFTSFSGRLGGGFSHEYGGPSHDYVPEAVFGLDFDRRLGKRQKLSVKFDYMPDVTHFGEYRLRTNASWEFLFDKETNLSFKLNVLDRYDSTPDGAKANDLDYSAVLLWKF